MSSNTPWSMPSHSATVNTPTTHAHHPIIESKCPDDNMPSIRLLHPRTGPGTLDTPHHPPHAHAHASTPLARTHGCITPSTTPNRQKRQRQSALDPVSPPIWLPHTLTLAFTAPQDTPSTPHTWSTTPTVPNHLNRHGLWHYASRL